MKQKAVEEKADILLVSEFYKPLSEHSWYEDTSHRAAILVRNHKMSIRNIGQDFFGFVYLTIGKLRIYSVYISPNIDYNAFADIIRNLENSIRGTDCDVIIGGDFNSKSPEWNSRTLDKRGNTLCEMIASQALTVFNNGHHFTFKRGNSGSIIDITFGTTSLYNDNMRWKVLDDITLSDHQYITFNIDKKHTGAQYESNLPKWNVRKLNREKLSQYLIHMKERSQNQTVNRTPSEAIGVLNTLLTKSCNISMPKSKPYTHQSPVYWWNEKVSKLRKECHEARRAKTRNYSDMNLRLNFKNARRALKRAIKESRDTHSRKMCNDIDTDPWGKPYKIVTKKFVKAKPIPGIKEPRWAKTIVEKLFPTDHELYKEVKLPIGTYEDLSNEEVRNRCKSLKNNKCPGPDGVPNEILQIIGNVWPEILTYTFNICLKNGIFPTSWKIQQLVLLRKGDKPLDQPSSYRPLCMIDTVGKLFESLILKKLEDKIEELGGLSSSQYGFRKGRSTVDAISEVVSIAEMAKATKSFCAIITLDVQNAFNSAKWNVIKNAFRKKGLNGYLYNIIDDYLDDRILLYETTQGIKKYCITSGVPQGSVLGPFLWNVMYDGLLNMELPKGAKLIGYADDIALINIQPTSELIQIVGNDSLRRCSHWLRKHGLQLAAHKTEAILVTNKRKFIPPRLRQQDVDITLSKSLCYLGVQLDDKLNFCQHIKNIRNKAIRTATTLARLMPNIGGPRQHTRRLINSVVYSQLLYAAPTFEIVAKNKSRILEILKPQRICALRTIAAYRTVSTAAALVLAGTPPIDLLILEKKEIYKEIKHIESSTTDRQNVVNEVRKMARINLITKWQERWQEEEKGRWTYHLIKDIKPWLERKHGNMNYYLTQVMTNHGDFNQYLYRYKIKSSPTCDWCPGEQETASHMLFTCVRWNAQRHSLCNLVNDHITPENILQIMLRSQEAWTYCERYINTIMKTKSIISFEPPRENRGM